MSAVIALAVITGADIPVYVTTARKVIGGTAGERLTSVRYDSA